MTYHKPLNILSWLVILFGFYFILTASILKIDPSYNFLFSHSYSTSVELSPAGVDLINALLTIMGGIMVAWGILINYLSKNFNKLVQKFVTASFLAWFAIDVTGSLLNSLEYNVLVDCLILTIALVTIYWYELFKIEIDE